MGRGRLPQFLHPPSDRSPIRVQFCAIEMRVSSYRCGAAASAALMKHLRSCVDDCKVTVRSLSHNMRSASRPACRKGRDMITLQATKRIVTAGPNRGLR